MSSPVASLPIGVRSSSHWRVSGSEIICRVCDVCTYPGWTELTLMLSFAYWIAADLEKIRIAPLAALYATPEGGETMP